MVDTFYDGAVFGLTHLGRRFIEAVVSLFAILGFVYVPLGRHTGLEHAKAVLATPAATAAVADLTNAALDLRRRAFDFVSARLQAAPEGAPPRAPARSSDNQPRPTPPKLK